MSQWCLKLGEPVSPTFTPMCSLPFGHDGDCNWADRLLVRDQLRAAAARRSDMIRLFPDLVAERDQLRVEVDRLRGVEPVDPGVSGDAVDATIVLLGARVREARAKRAAKGLPSCADDIPVLRKLAALMEETGEVALAIQDEEGMGRLRDELFDVAVVAVLWAATVRPSDACAWADR